MFVRVHLTVRDNFILGKACAGLEGKHFNLRYWKMKHEVINIVQCVEIKGDKKCER